MTSGGADRSAASAGDAAHNQTPRLVVSWLVVGLPLAYGIWQTINKTLPLFGG